MPIKFKRKTDIKTLLNRHWFHSCTDTAFTHIFFRFENECVNFLPSNLDFSNRQTWWLSGFCTRSETQRTCTTDLRRLKEYFLRYPLHFIKDSELKNRIDHVQRCDRKKLFT